MSYIVGSFCLQIHFIKRFRFYFSEFIYEFVDIFVQPIFNAPWNLFSIFYEKII